MIGGDKDFFAVENGGIVGGAVVAARGGKRVQIDLNAALKGGVGFSVKVWIKQVGDLRLVEAELDQGGFFSQSSTGYCFLLNGL